MRYNENAWNDAVDYYKALLRERDPKSIFIHGDISRSSFYSLAPISRAANEAGIDMCVKLGSIVDYLFDVWNTYEELMSGVENPRTKSMKGFLVHAGFLKKYFQQPDLILKAGGNGFCEFKYRAEWMQCFMEKELIETAQKVAKEVFALKKEDRFGIGFEFVLKDKDLKTPLQDYLDSYQIC